MPGPQFGPADMYGRFDTTGDSVPDFEFASVNPVLYPGRYTFPNASSGDTNPSTVRFATKVAGDAFDRLQILADGTIKQGDGTTVPYASPLADSVLQPMVRAGSNLYFNVPTVGLSTTGAATTSVGFAQLMVPRACTLTEIGVHTTVAGSAGSAFRLGIYSDNTATPGIPEALFADFGQVDTSTAAGNKMITGLSQVLQPYVQYWLVGASQLNVSTTIAAGSNGAVLPQATINVASTTGFPASGTIYVNTFSQGYTAITYTGATATTFTGCAGGTATLATGLAVHAFPATHPTIRVMGTLGAYGSTSIATYYGAGPQTFAIGLPGPLHSTITSNMSGSPAGAVPAFIVRLSAA